MAKYLKIVEYNQWEREAWNFLFSLDDNDDQMINYLISLVNNITIRSRKLLENKNRPMLVALSMYQPRIVTDPDINAPSNCTYMTKNNMMNKISPRKLKSITKKFWADDKRGEFNDPFYKGGIAAVTYKR
jgi:hypothetical protein